MHTWSEQRRPSSKTLCLFTRQLATLLKAGIPPLAALAAIKSQTTSRSLQRATQRVSDTLIEGGTLASGFALTPEIFSRLYIALIASGEQAGILDRTLESLVKSLERTRSLRSRIARAAMYPLLVIITLCGVTAFMLTWIIPTFEALFSESAIALPWLTAFVIALSRHLGTYWGYYLIAISVCCISLGYLLTNAPTAIRVLDRLKLALPVVSGLTRASLTCECTSLLAALIGAGIPIIQAVEIAADTVQHSMLSQQLTRTKLALLDGVSLTQALQHVTVLPALVSQMVGVGEVSGQLEEMLSKVASLFDEEIEASLKTVTDLAEPLLILSVGGIVGTLVVAMYLPLFQLGQLAGAQ
jgi:type IV pilus assembly protein PilC